MKNYARHRSTGNVVVFVDGDFHPRRPSEWALWIPIERLRSAHRIGEDPDIYWLRQLEVSSACREASMLRRRWKREGLSAADRERIAELRDEHLGGPRHERN